MWPKNKPPVKGQRSCREKSSPFGRFGFKNSSSVLHVLPFFCAQTVAFQIKLLKERRQLVCSYLCSLCMPNNPTEYLFLDFLAIVFSGIIHTVFSPNLLHAVHFSHCLSLTESLPPLALPVRYLTSHSNVGSTVSAP